MTKAIIFDCFGVLVADALKVICDELHAKDPQAVRDVKDLIRANNLGMIEPAESNRQIAAILGVSVEDFRSRIAHNEIRDDQLFGYIETELKPHYKIGMLSNIALSSLQRRFTPEEFKRYFDVVIASGEIGYAKPQPEAYLITAERLGVEPADCIFVDDREHFAATAREVGMQSICYTSFQQFTKDLESIL